MAKQLFITDALTWHNLLRLPWQTQDLFTIQNLHEQHQCRCICGNFECSLTHPVSSCSIINVGLSGIAASCDRMRNAAADGPTCKWAKTSICGSLILCRSCHCRGVEPSFFCRHNVHQAGWHISVSMSSSRHIGSKVLTQWHRHDCLQSFGSKCQKELLLTTTSMLCQF